MNRAGKLAPEVNRILFVKNLGYNASAEDLFELFGKFGPIRQIRQGYSNETKGTAFVVYEEVMDATGLRQAKWIQLPKSLPRCIISSAREDGQVETRPRRSSSQARSS